MFAIVDLETTGSKPSTDRVIEIGVVLHNGSEIEGTYSWLINPECGIPPYIQGMTGITSEMVRSAPKFYEVAKEIVELTEGRIFVAHNVRFDYSFLKAEFSSLGYNFQRKCLCTVRLSKKHLPQYKSHSLGKLAEAMGIPIPKEERHRALGDAIATAKIFDIMLNERGEGALLEKFDLTEETKTALFPPSIPSELVYSLPDTPGVYYFHNQTGQVIYVGMSKNIRKRVLQHFQPDHKSNKYIDFKGTIYDVTYELCGTETVSLLYESHLIKTMRPFFNAASKRAEFTYGLYYDVNQAGYICFSVKKTKNAENLVTQLGQRNGGDKQFLQALRERFNLCQSFTQLYSSQGPCLEFALGNCQGACCGLESPEDYNGRAIQAIKTYSYPHPSFFLLGKGRKHREQSVIWVEDGIYRGFGFIDDEYGQQTLESLKDCISFFPDNKDCRAIIRRGLSKAHPQDIIVYPASSHT